MNRKISNKASPNEGLFAESLRREVSVIADADFRQLEEEHPVIDAPGGFILETVEIRRPIE